MSWNDTRERGDIDDPAEPGDPIVSGAGPWRHPDHISFAEDMKEAGLAVQEYRGRFWWKGPAVMVDDIQDALGATKVRCQWDHMGLGWVVYPRAYDHANPDQGPNE